MSKLNFNWKLIALQFIIALTLFFAVGATAIKFVAVPSMAHGFLLGFFASATTSGVFNRLERKGRQGFMPKGGEWLLVVKWVSVVFVIAALQISLSRPTLLSMEKVFVVVESLGVSLVFGLAFVRELKVRLRGCLYRNALPSTSMAKSAYYNLAMGIVLYSAVLWLLSAFGDTFYLWVLTHEQDAITYSIVAVALYVIVYSLIILTRAFEKIVYVHVSPANAGMSYTLPSVKKELD